MSIKSGRGRPTKYTTSSSRLVRKYTNDCLSKGIFPTIEGLATFLGVGTRTLCDWELEHADFSQTMEMCEQVFLVTLDLWKPNLVIADLVKLFDLFSPDMRQLSASTDPK